MQSGSKLGLEEIKGDIQQLGTHLDLNMVVSDGIREQLADLQKLTRETSEQIRFCFCKLVTNSIRNNHGQI